MNKEDLIYFAGYFDADGHVTGQRRKDRRREIAFKIGVTGAVLERLEEFKAAFGGDMTITHKKGYQWKPGSPTSTRTTYQWIVGYQRAEKFIRAILPYMRTKVPQAEAFLKARKTYSYGGRVSQRTWDLRLDLLNQIRQLNRPGSKVLTW